MSHPSVAVIGGGQLARMMQQAAIGLNVHVRALVEEETGSTAQVVPDSSVGSPSDADALVALTTGCDVVTFEHEHVPASSLAAVAAHGTSIQPAPEALLYAQDKIEMRDRLTELAVPIPAWTVARTQRDLEEFGARVGWPVVAKTPRGGYDGKGVAVLQAGDTLPFEGSPANAILLEEHVKFQRELAVLIARSPSGDTRTWPVVQTTQRDGVCAEVISPAPDLSPDLAAQAEEIAHRIADGLEVTGVLAVELFEAEGALLVNELAMRPHNSGHVTIDAHCTSQFEQHLRAVLDLPLGATEQRAPWGVMVNVLGSTLTDPHLAYRDVMSRYPALKIHLYGKSPRPGRKLGHVTAVGSDLAQARRAAWGGAALLMGEDPT